MSVGKRDVMHKCLRKHPWGSAVGSVMDGLGGRVSVSRYSLRCIPTMVIGFSNHTEWVSRM